MKYFRFRRFILICEVFMMIMINIEYKPYHCACNCAYEQRVGENKSFLLPGGIMPRERRKQKAYLYFQWIVCFALFVQVCTDMRTFYNHNRLFSPRDENNFGQIKDGDRNCKVRGVFLFFCKLCSDIVFTSMHAYLSERLFENKVLRTRGRRDENRNPLFSRSNLKDERSYQRVIFVTKLQPLGRRCYRVFRSRDS